MSKELSDLKYCEYALSLRDSIETQFLLLGEALYKIREQGLYKSQWETFDEYTMELKGFSPASISKLINIYRKFVLEYKIPIQKLSQVRGWTLLADTLPHVHDSHSANEWVEKAVVLGRRDLNREIQEQKSGKPQLKCKHAETYLIRVCKECGMRERVYE